MEDKAILLVEDHKSTGRLVIGTLNDIYPSLSEKLGTIKWVRTPAEAEAALQSKTFAAAIIDDSFKEGNAPADDKAGIELVRNIRAGMFGAAHAKIPLLGNYSHADTKEAFEKAGVSQCNAKEKGQGYLDFIRDYNLAQEEKAAFKEAAR